MLPGSVPVFILAGVVWSTAHTKFAAALVGPDEVVFWLAIVIGTIVLGVVAWTTTLFVKRGEGTPPPWNPPNQLVIRGPYCHVRNPMITSVILLLMAEVLFLQSWPIAVWMLMFILGNAIYFPLIEERELEWRLGQQYHIYRINVPRWLPRFGA